MKRKLLLLTVKFLPIIHMVGFLINNTFVYFDIVPIDKYNIDFMFGDSIINIIAFIIISFGLYYCAWHRLIIIANGVNITITYYDVKYGIDITDLELLIIYYVISSIFILIGTYIHIKYDKVKLENQAN